MTVITVDIALSHILKLHETAAIFTNKRLIVCDGQGLGKKIEIYSLPYSSINRWSTKNAGTLDFSAEVELWTRSGHLKIKLMLF
ncbi:PH domain-containing protein [Streptococcus merionis]|uniref:PH domain-containing protein n=1 Tax=Streptococcus merionis TaxID=400065 RepID=UPI00351430F7